MDSSEVDSFENAAARHWVANVLVDSPDLGPVRAALQRIVNENDPPDLAACRAAVAAAEIVAALSGRPRSYVPDPVAAWIVAHPHPVEPALANLATQAVARVLYEPAMHRAGVKQWDVEQWRQLLDELHDRIEGRPRRPQITLTLSDGARASNPARIRLNPWLWLRHYPLWPTVGVVSVALAPFYHLKYGGDPWTPAYLAGVNVFYWFRKFEHFAHGDCNPGVIVSLNPPRMAVATDLTTGEGYFPALKVVRCPLRQSGGRPLALGMVLPTVSLYLPQLRGGRYATFFPFPVECGTNDPAAYHGTLGSFTPQNYEFLQQLVDNAPSLNPGLYHFDEDTLQPL